jgi:hypothetical protein
MGQVKINDKYRVDVDGRQLTLQEFKGTRKVKKTGKDVDIWESLGYYGTWEGLLNALAMLMVSDKIGKQGEVQLSDLSGLFAGVKADIRRITGYERDN